MAKAGTKSKTATKSKVKPTKATAKKPRKIQKPTYKTFRMSKRIRHEAEPLPKARKILASAWRHLLKNKRLFIGILLVHIVLTLLLVQGFNIFSGQFSETKGVVEELLEGDKFFTSLTLFGILLTSSGQGVNELSNFYGMILLIVNGLAVIWALRQTHAKSKPKLKEAYYKGMYPLIPCILVLCVMLLQLLPFIIGNLIYSIVISNGIAVTGLEQVIWLSLFISLGLVSFYMLTSSIFALFIVTLPDVTPMQALRSARQLVLNRRLMIVRKLVFMPFVLLFFAVIIMAPIIIFVPAIAEVTFFVFSMISLLVTSAYLYEVYRELL